MIQPLTNRVLVELDKVQHITPSGIFVGEIQAPQALRCKVLAIGSEVELVSIGDVVYCGQYAPTEVKETPADKTMIIPEEDILGVLVPVKSAK